MLLKTIQNRIYEIRGQKVMLDFDLAELYEVETKYLNRAVKRNVERFPKEFMFKLTKKEKNELVTKCHRFNTMKHSASMPYAFTEQGVAMLSSVLKSKRAIHVNIQIMKIFVKVRQMMMDNSDLRNIMNGIIKKYNSKFKDYDYKIELIFEAINQILTPEPKKKRKIGFITGS